MAKTNTVRVGCRRRLLWGLLFAVYHTQKKYWSRHLSSVQYYVQQSGGGFLVFLNPDKLGQVGKYRDEFSVLRTGLLPKEDVN